MMRGKAVRNRGVIKAAGQTTMMMFYLCTFVNHRKSCMSELLYESSTSTMGICSSAVTSKLSLW